MVSLIKLLVSLLLFFFSTLLIGEINGVESLKHHQLKGPKTLFVFGDSYVDTGNLKKNKFVPWSFPYGITFPGKPSGRFSDGRVSTDFLAKLLGLKSPIPYLWKDYAGKERLHYGMNFAYGGTGVFKTQSTSPNMTVQINLFEQILGDIYSPSDLSSSLALVSVAGNDYYSYLLQNGTAIGLFKLINQVVNQAEVNLKRLHTLGVRKIAIHSLHPLGCLPIFSKDTSYQRCNDIVNLLVISHNNKLRQIVAKLNKENNNNSTFVIIDIYNAFLTAFKSAGVNPGSMKFKTPYKSCCEGVCGTVDEKGVKQYTLCDDPKSSFFWDGLHPTQEGWTSVYAVLGKNLTSSLTKA